MRTRVLLVLCLLLVVALIGLAIFYTDIHQPPHVTEPGQPRVKLAVLVVFDQMRGDYLEKWQPLFRPDGFVRLQTDGAWFTKCNYPYGTTTTGPGHASMLSGTCADRHGIVNNNWFENGEVVYCAGSKRYEFVPGPRTKPDPKAKPKEVGNPDRMLAETIADVLKAAHPNSKVFGLSLKDRSAILPTGKHPDGAYWFTTQFVTSTYYTERAHSWVEEFNASKFADQWFGKEWDRFRTDIDYEKWSGPDIVAGEGKGTQVTAKDDPARGWAQGVGFPHPNTGGRAKPGKEYYESLVNSPFGNDLLLELAKRCVTAEQLGTHDSPDLLVVSFSSNDLIGHTWGPDSQEVFDVTLRSDALMANLLAFLDEKVGKGQYLLAVTADHGVCPLPEVSRKQGIDAKRVDPKAIQKALEEHLTAKFGAIPAEGKDAKKPAWVEAFASPSSDIIATFPWVYFNQKVIAAAGKSQAEVAKAAAEFLSKHADVARAFTRADLEGSFPPDDPIANRVKRSYYPSRSGDVYVVLKPHYLPSALLGTGTTHGAPFDYDTHVPLLVYGPGIAGGTRTEPTTPQAAAAIFAKWLDVKLPNKAEFPVPETLEKN
jgi:predicted AlkP superfamily pyrophosphatase or phosphodiesterase